MKTVYHNKTTKETFVFSCKTDLKKITGVNEVTLWRWSKEGMKETKDFILYFNCEEKKSRNKRGNVANLTP